MPAYAPAEVSSLYTLEVADLLRAKNALKEWQRQQMVKQERRAADEARAADLLEFDSVRVEEEDMPPEEAAAVEAAAAAQDKTVLARKKGCQARTNHRRDTWRKPVTAMVVNYQTRRRLLVVFLLRVRLRTHLRRPLRRRRRRNRRLHHR